jgi:hypothetical protein
VGSPTGTRAANASARYAFLLLRPRLPPPPAKFFVPLFCPSVWIEPSWSSLITDLSRAFGDQPCQAASSISSPLLRRAGIRLDNLLIQQGRWPDMAVLYPDPFGDLREVHEMLRMATEGLEGAIPEDQRGEMHALHERMFREKAGKLHAVLLAAGRDAEGMKLAEESIKLDDTPAMRVALVRWAVNAKQPRQRHSTLLDEAAQKDPKAASKGLRKKLDAGLAAAASH